jgi:hypothetical protein
MRDLMRAHIEISETERPLHNLLDNTWVLVGLLLLLLGGGVLWYRSGQETPDEQFQRGVALMERPRGAAWDEAKADVFEPLVAADPDAWTPKVQPYLDQIAAYETERRLLRTNPAERTDAERFFVRALEERDNGQFEAAERTLGALRILLEADPEAQPLQQAASVLIEQIRAQKEKVAEDVDRYALLKANLQLAGELHAAGDHEAAAAIWRSLLDLYDGDPGAAPLLEEVRGRLAAASP